jgi:hypothetical protein
MKPINILMNIIYPLLFFSLFSCSTYKLMQIQILKPASIKLSGNINKILLVNHAVLRTSTFTSVDNGTLTNENKDSIRTSEYFNGLCEVLSNSPRFETFNISPVYIAKSNFNERYYSLEWPVIKKLCNDSSADAAIVLENFQVIYLPKGTMQYNDEFGYFKGTLEMDNSSLWKIYVPANNKIEDDFLETDTLCWDGYGFDESTVLEQFPDISDAILQSCFYAGKKYGQRIAQTWETRSRYLIYCNNKDFRKAHKLATNENWEEAIEIWKKYPYGKKKRLAAYAAYNLAVASEVLDHIDVALDWASKSFFLKNDILVENYIKILEKRKTDKDIIEDQFK